MPIIQSPQYVFLDLYPSQRDAATQAKMLGVREELQTRGIDFFSFDPSYVFVDADRVEEARDVARAAGFVSVRAPVDGLRFNPDRTIYQPHRNALAIVTVGLAAALLISIMRGK